MSTTSEIGARILECRTRLRLSQQQVADVVGIAAAQFYRYEAGRSKPRPAMADRIAESLGVATQWLLTGTGVMERNERDDTGLRDNAPGLHLVRVEFTANEARALRRQAKIMGVTPEQAIKMALYKGMNEFKAETEKAAEQKPSEE